MDFLKSMAKFDPFGSKRLARSQRDVAEIKTVYEKLTRSFAEFQTAYAERVSSSLNPYTTHESQVKEAIDKYNGESEFGCELVQRIINMTAAFTMPNGMELVEAEDFVQNGKADNADAERAYIAKWLDRTNLSQGGTLKLAQEANLQGQIQLTLGWVKSKDPQVEGEVVANYRSWIDNKCKISQVGASNLTGPYKLDYKEGDKELTANENAFVFLLLNSRLGTTEGRPRIGAILHVLEYISQNLTDDRKNNELFGHPLPYFKCGNKNEVDIVTEGMKKKTWNAGRGFASTADFSLVSPSGTGDISTSITTCIKIVCATTGISPHFLGFPDLLSNRSTADAMGEPTEIVSRSEMTVWEAFYESLFDKVIRMRNMNIGNGIELREGIIKPRLLPLSDRQWQRLKDVWLEMLKEGAVSLETFLSQVPNVDVETELTRLNESAPTEPKAPASGFSGAKEPVED